MMAISRALTIFLVALGLTFGSMTANALVVKQAFAKPCPMELTGQKEHCPCCNGPCDSAMLICAAKCSSHQTSAALADGTRKLVPLKVLLVAKIVLLHDQFANGPAPPVPIA